MRPSLPGKTMFVPGASAVNSPFDNVRFSIWRCYRAEVDRLVSCEPRIAAEQDELASRGRLGQMTFDGFPVVRLQTADDFRDAAALTGSGQLKRPVDGRCIRHHRFL